MSLGPVVSFHGVAYLTRSSSICRISIATAPAARPLRRCPLLCGGRERVVKEPQSVRVVPLRVVVGEPPRWDVLEHVARLAQQPQAFAVGSADPRREPILHVPEYPYDPQELLRVVPVEVFAWP